MFGKGSCGGGMGEGKKKLVQLFVEIYRCSAGDWGNVDDDSINWNNGYPEKQVAMSLMVDKEAQI